MATCLAEGKWESGRGSINFSIDWGRTVSAKSSRTFIDTPVIDFGSHCCGLDQPKMISLTMVLSLTIDTLQETVAIDLCREVKTKKTLADYQDDSYTTLQLPRCESSSFYIMGTVTMEGEHVSFNRRVPAQDAIGKSRLTDCTG